MRNKILYYEVYLPLHTHILCFTLRKQPQWFWFDEVCPKALLRQIKNPLIYKALTRPSFGIFGYYFGRHQAFTFKNWTLGLQKPENLKKSSFWVFPVIEQFGSCLYGAYLVSSAVFWQSMKGGRPLGPHWGQVRPRAWGSCSDPHLQQGGWCNSPWPSYSWWCR